MSKYPKNPFIRGAFHKSNKEFTKLRKLKKREYTPNILDKLDNLQTNNPKEYDLVSNIDCNTWSDYFSNLSKTPAVRGQVIIPTAHFSDSPLLRQPIILTAHYSDNDKYLH